MISSALLGNFLTIGATAVFAASFTSFSLMMDANPTLFLYDKFRASQNRLRDHFSGKTIWIVGTSSGIGAEVARQLSSHGATVILSSRPSDALDQVAVSCRLNYQQHHDSHPSTTEPDKQKTNGPTFDDNDAVLVVPLDLTGPTEDLERAVDQVEGFISRRESSDEHGGSSSTRGKLDCIILNAGRGHLSPASQTSRETSEQMFQLNILAPIHLTQLLFHRGLLQEQKTNHLVVTSSVGAKFGVPLSAAYAASKHALHGYYNSLQAEWPWLRVDLVCPGPVDTAFHRHSKKKKEGELPLSDTESDSLSLSSSSTLPRRELKMPVQRCAALMVSSIMMGGGSNNERWIAEQPTLLGLYMNQHFPGIFQRILRTIGPMRVQAWKEGKNLYDPETWKKGRSSRKS